MAFRRLAAFVLYFVWAVLGFGQAPTTTGVRPWESTSGEVALDTLNIHLDIPIVTKNGIGLPFSFGLHFNNNFWYPFAGQWVSGSPTTDFGWFQDDSQNGRAFGTFNWSVINTPCAGRHYRGYVDVSGATHPMSVDVCNGSYAYQLLTDGSGLYAKVGGAGGTNTMTLPSGAVLTPSVWGNPLVDGSLADTDGNVMGYHNASHSYTDTLGVTEISETFVPNVSNTYTYPTASGTASVVANYSLINIGTRFGCGNTLEYSPQSRYLVTSVVVGDGTQYTFGYEPTPGMSGYYTGRLASLRLPAGGTVNYTYSGPNNGINCADGTTAGLTKTTSDGSWTYTRDTYYWNSTTVIDPSGNQTVHTFSSATFRGLAALGPFYETQTVSYQGSTSGTPLSTEVTCYNENQSNCPTAAAPNLPVTQTDVYTTLAPMTQSSRVTTTYDSYGNVTEVDRYDFGATNPTTRRHVYYGTVSGSQCLAIGNGINDRPCSIQDWTGTGSTILTDVTFAYDSYGNLLTKTMWPNWPSSTPTLTQTYTYNTNGTVHTSTDVNGAQTTYHYNGTGGCNNGLVTSVTRPLSLTTSYTWDCNGAVMKTSTDPNGQVTTTDYVGDGADPFFRPDKVTDPTGAVVEFEYHGGAQTWAASLLNFNSGSSIVNIGTGLDPYGRPIESSDQTAPGVSSWDIYPVAYDSNGRLFKTYMPCTTTGAWTCSTPYTSYTYDALNRPLVTTDGGGGTITRSYSGRDVTITLGPAPSGEAVKTLQKEYDGLGRLKSVCQLSSASGSGPCGQDLGGTGFVTTYSYDALGHVMQVIKNAQSSTQQTRSFTYDALGRVLTESYPESGATTYIYDTTSGSTCTAWGTITSNGDMVCSKDANGYYTIHFYDALHRLTDVGATNPSDYCKRFRYDHASGVLSPPSGYVGNNTLGRLVEAETDNCGASGTGADEWFNYSARGETQDVWEATPHSGGYYHTSASYWANGTLNSVSGVPGQAVWWYMPDSAGRPYSSGQGSTSWVTNTTYNAGSQPTVVSLGLGDSANYSYDPNTGRMTNYTFTVGSTPKSMVGNLTWNANATLRTLQITDGFNSGGAQTCNYGTSSVAGYDELGRLVNVNCGSAWSQTFSYDPFDNITKTGSISWQPGYNQANNHYQLGGTSYDANGNVLSDSFNTYTWYSDNHLHTINATISQCGTQGTCLTYDAFSRMVEKNASGTYTQILYSPIGKTAQMNGQTFVSAYIPLPGGEALFATPTGQSFWFKDWLGTVRLSSSRANRTIDFDRAFAPFGEMYQNFGSTANQNFTGDTQDSVAGLFDTLFRELHPNQGRWISPDPAHSGWNAYAYASDPMTETDPSGLGDSPCPHGCNDAWTVLPVNWDSGSTPGGMTRPIRKSPRRLQPDNRRSLWWKLAHSLGFIRTEEDVAAERQWLQQHVISIDGIQNKDFAKLTPSQVDYEYIRAQAGIEEGRYTVLGTPVGTGFAGLKNAEPVGSALKDDLFHSAATWMRDEAAENGSVFSMPAASGGTSTLVQIQGDLNGIAGRYEYIVNSSGELTHQMFVPGGTINGIPIQP